MPQIGQIPHDLEAYVQSQIMSFDDVMQVERAMPFTVVEVYAVEDLVASLWQKRGKRAFLSSFALEFFSAQSRREAGIPRIGVRGRMGSRV